jgi:hypothetical protein
VKHATPIPSPERRLSYLVRLSRHDWGIPEGFGGRTCFQVIPSLEIERGGGEPGIFRWEWIDHSLDLIRQRKDCQDFAMVGLVRILFRYLDSCLLFGERRETVARVLRAAKFSENDPGEDSCCWLTENHQIQYLSSEYLAGQLFAQHVFQNTGKPGSWHRDRARDPLLRWLDWRFRFSFSEWNSSCYYDEDVAALLNLAEFADDEIIRLKASGVFQLLLFHVVVNSHGTIPAGSRGRAYLDDQIFPERSPMALLLKLIWGAVDEPCGASLGLAAVSLAAGGFSLSPVFFDIGAHPVSEYENRERHGLDPEEAAAFGVNPENLEDFPFFCGSGVDQHHLVAGTRVRYHEGKEKWPGYFYSHEFFGRCKAEGRPFDTRAIPYACTRAEVYSFRTPHYVLGCAQAYRPGAPGYQQFIWSATLGDRAVVFTTNPAPADVPYGRPGPWVGNGVLPKVVQHRNVLIAMHRVRPCPIYDQPPWYREDRVHAYFPRGLFDEVVDRGGWCFGRKDGGYIALRSLSTALWLPPGDLADKLETDQPYEWEVRSTDVVWICEMGSESTHGTFSAFVDRIVSARVGGDVDHVTFESPSLGGVSTGWDRGLFVAGKDIPIKDYPRFANPYCQAVFGAEAFDICAGNEMLRFKMNPEKP